MLERFGLVVGIIASLLGIWEGAARIVGGDGPVAIAKEIGGGSTTTTEPTITTNGRHLDKPSGVSVSGDCESGFTLTWQPVDGAETYRIERDGMYNGTARDTNHSIPAFPDEKQHSFQVFAEVFFPASRSEGSDKAFTEACSFSTGTSPTTTAEPTVRAPTVRAPTGGRSR